MSDATVSVRQSTAPAAPPADRSKMTPREKTNLRNGLLFISPWIVGVLAFVGYPIFYSLAISFTQYSGMQAPKWVGLSNYVRMATDPLAWVSAGNTLFFAGLAVPLGLFVSLLLALAMNRNVREVALYRTILYIPSLVPIFAMSFIFIVLVNPGFGVANQVLDVLGVTQSVDLLNFNGVTAKTVIVIMAQLGAGNAALIFLAGLNNIPQSLYEAAKIDGASPLTSFFRITIPLLSPAILFNLITGISGALQIFAQSYIMTNGGPNNGSLFFMHYLYQNAFSFAQLGYASALAMLLFAAGVVLAGLVYFVSRKFVNYDVST